MITWLLLISVLFLIPLLYALQEIYHFIDYDDKRCERISKVVKRKRDRIERERGDK